MGRRRRQAASLREIVIYTGFIAVWCVIAGEYLLPAAFNNMAKGMLAHAGEQRIELTQHRKTVWPTAFPSAPTVEWIRSQPNALKTAQLSIWDQTMTKGGKVLRIRRAGAAMTDGVNRDDPIATVYVPAGQHIDIMLQPGSYDVVAATGSIWSADTGFGSKAPTASYGSIDLKAGTPGVIAMGASDQPVKDVTADWL